MQLFLYMKNDLQNHELSLFYFFPSLLQVILIKQLIKKTCQEKNLWQWQEQ